MLWRGPAAQKRSAIQGASPPELHFSNVHWLAVGHPRHLQQLPQPGEASAARSGVQLLLLLQAKPLACSCRGPARPHPTQPLSRLARWRARQLACWDVALPSTQAASPCHTLRSQWRPRAPPRWRPCARGWWQQASSPPIQCPPALNRCGKGKFRQSESLIKVKGKEYRVAVQFGALYKLQGKKDGSTQQRAPDTRRRRSKFMLAPLVTATTRFPVSL